MFSKLKLQKNDIILAILFIILGIATRTIFHLGHNIEFITAISLAAGYFFVNKKFALIVPFAAMALSDTIIGNTMIFVFTWSAFLITALLGSVLSKFKLEKAGSLALASTFTGLLSTFVFFLWTNFGVVLTSNMYEKSFSGLIQSYINAIPFVRPQLEGNLVIVPIVFVATYLMLKLNIFKNSQINESVR